MSQDLLVGFKFESDSLAFYREDEKVYPCLVVSRELTNNPVKRYWVETLGGFKVLKDEKDLLTGFEEDFPTHDQIQWTNYFGLGLDLSEVNDLESEFEIEEDREEDEITEDDVFESFNDWYIEGWIEEITSNPKSTS